MPDNLLIALALGGAASTVAAAIARVLSQRAAAATGRLFRRRGRNVTIEIGGDRLEFRGASSEDINKILELWLREHGGSADSPEVPEAGPDKV